MREKEEAVSDMATVVISAKSTSDAYQPTRPFPPDPNSPQSTISTVEREIKEAGGEATARAADVRSHSSVQDLVKQTLQVSQEESHRLPPPPSPQNVLTSSVTEKKKERKKGLI